MSCFYDCSSQRAEQEPYADISGLGVIVGFLGTAYITVVIVVLYYFLGYDPKLDGFRKDGIEWSSTQARTPNPVDSLVLGLVQRHIKPRSRRIETSSWSDALNKSVLAMSDLQVVTGLAILISGFATLKCGLSDYHWQMIVYLAWFSSITHLAATTFLRNYLYNHQDQRFWRIILMTIFGIMLIAATVPTGGFEYIDGFEYAICYYGPLTNSNSAGFDSMIMTILLFAFSFTTRLIKLHKVTSQWINVSVRRKLSGAYRTSVLNRISKWVHPNRNPHHWKRTLVYLPALTVFLVLRVNFDLYSSMISEVYWLVVSAIWGTIKLYQTKAAVDMADENNWAFGQIIPLVLLIAPLFAIVEQLYSVRIQNKPTSVDLPSVGQISQAQDGHNPTTETLENENANHRTTEGMVEMDISDNHSQVRERYHIQSIYQRAIDDPDGDYFVNATWMHFLLVLELAMIVFFTVWMFLAIAIGNDVLQVFAGSVIWFELLPAFTLSTFTLFAFAIDRVFQPEHALYKFVAMTVLWLFCGLYVLFAVYLAPGGRLLDDVNQITIGDIDWYFMGAAGGLYILVCMVFSWKTRRTPNLAGN